jgi:hypothetical protein
MKYYPDSPKEISFLGASIGRLGTAMSAALLFQNNKWWVFLSLFLTWIGHEIALYFKLQAGEKIDD